MEDKEHRTLYCGNLSDKVTEDILYELFLQAGPLESVTIPKDKDGRQRNFGFITFKHAVSVPYSIALMNNISLYGKNLTLNPRNGSENEDNPYLQKLIDYRNSFISPMMNVNDNRGYGYDQRDTFDDRFRRGRRHPDMEYDMRSTYPGPSSYPVFNSPYSPLDGQSRSSQSSFGHSQRHGHSSRYDRSPNPWIGSRR